MSIISSVKSEVIWIEIHIIVIMNWKLVAYVILR